MASADARRIATRPVGAPILRAGLGRLPGFLSVIDDAVVAHLGFFRDPETLAAVPYYANLPADLSGRAVFALDPMLATGHSGAAALDVLSARGARDVSLLCVLAAPEGIAYLHGKHPSAQIVTCAVDERLNDHGYIVPGLGDAGDRMFGSASSVPVGYRAGQPRGARGLNLLGVPVSGYATDLLIGAGCVASVQTSAVTLGEAGMLLLEEGQKPYHTPTRAQEVFDVSGAGDTAIAAFTLALAAGANGIEAAEIANHAAGVVVAKLGTATLTVEELRAMFTKSGAHS